MKIQPNHDVVRQKPTKIEDPFDLELKIEPKRIQEFLNQTQNLTFHCVSEDDDCTRCGCNTCCSSC
jgi:hypothetical protein